MTKRILCYGDSNTWGSSDHDTRIDNGHQWPVILQTKLGSPYVVIQEGLAGRVAGNYEPKAYRNGKDHYEVAFRSASPLNFVVISLGTNDLKSHFNRTPEQIVEDLLWYSTETKRLAVDNENIQPKLIYVTPANFSSSEYFEADEIVRQRVIELLLKSGEQVVVLPEILMSSDGVHYSEMAHDVVAKNVFEKVMELA
jgi:lysophospholipase L1-like esterase